MDALTVGLGPFQGSGQQRGRAAHLSASAGCGKGRAHPVHRRELAPSPTPTQPGFTFYFYFLDHLITLNEFHKLVIWRQHRTLLTEHGESLKPGYSFENFIILKINQQDFPPSHISVPPLCGRWPAWGKGGLFFFPFPLPAFTSFSH